MSLLDAIVGEVLRNAGARRTPLAQAGVAALATMGLELLRRNGGIERTLARLARDGHASEADSWVSTGANLPIEPTALAQAFDADTLGRTAREAGIDAGAALDGLAEVFPEIVNQITPRGRVESGSDDLVAQALADLARRRAS